MIVFKSGSLKYGDVLMGQNYRFAQINSKGQYIFTEVKEQEIDDTTKHSVSNPKPVLGRPLC